MKHRNRLRGKEVIAAGRRPYYTTTIRDGRNRLFSLMTFAKSGKSGISANFRLIRFSLLRDNFYCFRIF